MTDPLRALIAKWEARADHGFDPEETPESLEYWKGVWAVVREIKAALAAEPHVCPTFGECWCEHQPTEKP